MKPVKKYLLTIMALTFLTSFYPVSAQQKQKAIIAD